MRLTFITGISKFTKVSLFSEVNHVQDLTLDNEFATAFGYTQTDVEAYFEPHIQSFLQKYSKYTHKKLLEEVKLWYNGYSWDGITSVYNPVGAFYKNDLQEVYYILCEVFEVLPNDVYKASNETLYHGLIHILFKYMGIIIQSEVHTKRGRLDAVVQSDTHVYIFEFKFNKTSEAAMTQLKKRDYATKFRNIPINSPSGLGGKIIIGIGSNFTGKTRSVDEWIIEEL